MLTSLSATPATPLQLDNNEKNGCDNIKFYIEHSKMKNIVQRQIVTKTQ